MATGGDHRTISTASPRWISAISIALRKQGSAFGAGIKMVPVAAGYEGTREVE